MTRPEDLSDLEIVARTIWAEAASDGKDMEAIACVIRNRVEADIHGDGKPDWWGEGWRGVCLAPWQFSCWNANDPQRARLLAVTEGNARYRKALDVARAAMDWRLADPTGGATHYYASYIAEPAWAKKLTPTVTIGVHRFFRDDAAKRARPAAPPPASPQAPAPQGPLASFVQAFMGLFGRR